jgi:transcriptional regulator NrdR family protein
MDSAASRAKELDATTTHRSHDVLTVPVFAAIVERDGSREPFDANRIARAIEQAGKATAEFGRAEAERLARRVLVIASATRSPRGSSPVMNTQLGDATCP